jgi:nucleoside 2-deoxyribosyltransferase
VVPARVREGQIGSGSAVEGKHVSGPSSQAAKVTYPSAPPGAARISHDGDVTPSASLSTLFAGGARPRAYVASPLGFSEAGRAYYAEHYLPALREHVQPVDPWALSDPEEFAAARAAGREQAFGVEVGARNAEAIAGSQLLVAHLDGQEVDAGTAAEVGYAAALRMPCVAIRSDLRSSGEPGMTVNLQVEAFVALSGGFIVRSLDELLARLAALRGAAVRETDRAVTSARRRW